MAIEIGDLPIIVRTFTKGYKSLQMVVSPSCNSRVSNPTRSQPWWPFRLRKLLINQVPSVSLTGYMRIPPFLGDFPIVSYMFLYFLRFSYMFLDFPIFSNMFLDFPIFSYMFLYVRKCFVKKTQLGFIGIIYLYNLELCIYIYIYHLFMIDNTIIYIYINNTMIFIYDRCIKP